MSGHAPIPLPQVLTPSVPSALSVKEFVSPLWDPLNREGFPFLPDHRWAETAPSIPELGRKELLFETNYPVENIGRLISSDLPTSLPTDQSKWANLGAGGKEGKGVPSVVNIPVMLSVTGLTVSV